MMLPTAVGAVEVRLGVYDDFVDVAARLPDSTFYRGDDLVLGLDPDASGGTSPGDGDRQWYLWRVLDSSVVSTAAGGR